MNDNERRALDIQKLAFSSIWQAVSLIESVTDGKASASILSAVEVVASILRRRMRDCGIKKEDIDALRADASKTAEATYEDSGAGREVRRLYAEHLRRTAPVPEAPPPDSAFTQAQADEAARITAEAFRRISFNKEN